MPEVVEFITSVAAVGTKVEGYVQLSEVVVNQTNLMYTVVISNHLYVGNVLMMFATLIKDIMSTVFIGLCSRNYIYRLTARKNK